MRENHISLHRYQRVFHGKIGWLTRDVFDVRRVIDPEMVSRTVLLLPDDAIGPLPSGVQTLLDHLRSELHADLPTLGRTGASKHVVNDLLGGTSPLSGEADLVVPIYKYGPIPAVVIENGDTYRVAAFHQFHGDRSIAGRALKSALLERLESYKWCSLPLLLSHYCEHIAGRMHDAEWCRSTEGAWQECCAIRMEVYHSIFSKVNDVESGMKSSDPETREFARQLHHASYFRLAGRLAGLIALNLADRFCGAFSLRLEAADHSSLISALCRSGAIDFDQHIVLRGLRDIWSALGRRDVDELKLVAMNTEPGWVREFSEFAGIVAALEGDASDQLARDRKDRRTDWQRPRLYLSHQFESSPNIVRNVTLLPSLAREQRLPFEVCTGVETFGNVVDNVRFKMLTASVVMPFLPSESDVRRDYSWIIKEVEHGVLCWKKIVPTMQEGPDVGVFQDQVSTFSSWLLKGDPRVPSDSERRARVREALETAWVVLPQTGIGGVNEDLLRRLQVEAVNAATRKAQDILSYLLCGMEGNVRRWVISILISTSDGPKMRGELLNSLRHNWRLIGSRRPSKQYQFSDREFDQSRGKYYQYPARLLTPSGPVPLVSQRSGKYIGNLEVLLRNVGLTYSNQTERQTAKVHLLRNVDFR